MHTSYFLNQFAGLETNLKQQIVQLFHPIIFEKNENLVKKGEHSNKIFFIESGIIAEYSDSDNDYDSIRIQTHWILGENEWVFQVHSFLNNEPSDCTIKALENVKAVYLTKQEFYHTRNDFPEIMVLINKIFERYLLQLENRNKFHRIKNASNRLAYFEKNQPSLSNRVQMKYIASYLNINPSELSRIRNKRCNTIIRK